MDATEQTPSRRVDPVRALASLDVRTLLPLLPYVDASLLTEVRREVAQRALRSDAETWQQAWNAATGATPHHAGQVRFSAHVRCDACHGRRFGMHGVCVVCVGQGRKFTHITQRALWAAPDPERIQDRVRQG